MLVRIISKGGKLPPELWLSGGEWMVGSFITCKGFISMSAITLLDGAKWFASMKGTPVLKRALRCDPDIIDKRSLSSIE